MDLSAYPLGGRDPQTVLVRLKTADVADLGDEVDILPILGLPALASLVFSVEVVEAAGQDEVSAGVGRPKKKRHNNNTNNRVSMTRVGAFSLGQPDNAESGATPPPGGRPGQRRPSAGRAVIPTWRDQLALELLNEIMC